MRLLYMKTRVSLKYFVNDWGDKFMPEIHLRRPGFTYKGCESFSKNKERIQKFKETGDSRYIYQKELDTNCF